MQYRVDVNCDMGESFGCYTLGQDQDILHVVTSANIACGYHAGDPRVMNETVKLAIEHGVAVGAHPGYPDLNGFGRRAMQLTFEEIYQLMIYQVGALQAFARVHGGQVEHVKPHGALYNEAARVPIVAEAIAQAVIDLDQSLILFALAGSELVKAGRKVGLQVAEEVFADRNYQPDGTLTPRNKPDAMIHDSRWAAERAVRMVKEGKVITTDGTERTIQADTICIHGDEPGALGFAHLLLVELTKEGIELRKVGGNR